MDIETQSFKGALHIGIKKEHNSSNVKKEKYKFEIKRKSQIQNVRENIIMVRKQNKHPKLK